MNILKILCVAIGLSALFTGCATNQNSSSGSGPTVSGYIDTGAQKRF
jgi:hypothetical protein